MLVVTRNAHESVVVGEDKGLKRIVKVTVLSVDGSRVKLGFDIQDDVSMERLEDWNQLHGYVHTDRLLPQPAAIPLARDEHRWNAIPQPGPHCWPVAAVGEFV